MRIGIMTYFYGANYGAKAQSYALQHVIENMGHECIMVNYRPKGYAKLNLLMNLNVLHLKKHPILTARCLLRAMRFRKVTNQYKQSARLSSSKEIDELGLDTIVFGSDAIFNASHKSFDTAYMGVGIQKTRKVAYAPSCENLDPECELSEACRNSLKGFAELSVRDQNTQRLLKNNIDKDVIRVVDPTLLYSFSEIVSDWNEKDYILIYTFSDWKQYSPQFQEFARSKGCKLISIGKYLDWADKSYDAADFRQWISAFRDAKYVLTDSFHGLVFSIKNKKEIILCSREDKKAKVESLLIDAGIERRFFSGGESVEEYLSDTPIDYSNATSKLNSMITQSIVYLKKCL